MIGLLAGVDGLGINFNNFPLAFMLGSLALAVILFDFRFRHVPAFFRIAACRPSPWRHIGVVLTAAIFAFAASLLLGLSWLEGMLLGSIVASTDAAAVFFLLRIGGIHIRDKSARRWRLNPVPTIRWRCSSQSRSWS